MVVGGRERRRVGKNDSHVRRLRRITLVVRSWNVFHGNAHPPERRAFLEEMIGLVTADGPDIVCLQEVPAWALTKLGRWSGMQAVGAIAARPRLGSALLGRWITEAHHGVLRSAVTGQANAILVSGRHAIGHVRSRVVSTSRERRICHTVRLDEDIVVANFHVTGGDVADEQFGAVADFAEEEGGSRLLLAGDANLRPGEGQTYGVLRMRGFSEPLPESIDQILARGLPVRDLAVWPDERRRLGRRLLSDHAPVEAVVG